MNIEKVEFTVPKTILSALIDGNISGLDETEILAVEDLDQQAADCTEEEKGSYYCWAVRNDSEPFFTSHHNALGMDAADCLSIECMIFIDETREIP